MRRLGLVWRFFLPCAALLAGTAAVVGWLAAGRLERTHLDDQRRSLETEALLLAQLSRPALDGEAEAAAQALLADMGRRTGLRLSVIRRDGRVVADSDVADLRSVAPHGTEREELREALEEPFGFASRQSDTLHAPTLYVAVRVERAGEVLGWARVSRPATLVAAEVDDLQADVLRATGVALAVGLAAAWLLARRLAQPLRRLTGAADAMAAGDLAVRVRAGGGREVASLASAFNAMADQLQQRVRDVEEGQGEVQAVLASMVEGVLAIDEQERVVLLNEAGARILGLDAATAAGRPWYELLRMRELGDALSAAQREGQPQAVEVRRPGRGHDTVLALQAAPLARPGRPGRGAVVVVHDVTELRQLEQVRRDFVANASHELKTPIAAVRGLVETILDDEAMEPATQRRFLASILAQSERMGVLVEEMLQLSRLEAQRQPLERAPLDLVPLVAEALEALQPLARERGLALAFEPTPGPVRALADPEPMQRILGNLAGNALAYTPRGGHVQVRLRREGGAVLLEVQDDGPGIPEGERERVFERFYRLDKGRSRQTGGTGLGLSIVKHLVQALGGEVRLEPAPGGGTLARVSLLAAEPA
ncbi:MAG: sensor histidine kinase [Planctomycetia bacterium]